MRLPGSSLVLACLVVACIATRASAQPCPESRQPGIVLRTEQLDSSFAAETRDHLRRALATRGLALCVGEGPGRAATLEMTPGADAVTMTIRVEDDVTNKRVSRDVDIRALPPDARPLALAQAADELLRASWAELFVEGSTKRPEQAPPEVVRAVQLRVASEEDRGQLTTLPPTSFALGIGSGAEFFSTGHVQLGPDATFSYYPWRWIGAAARAGLRSAASVVSRFGSVDSSSRVLSLGVGGRRALGSKLKVEAGPSLLAAWLSFEGNPVSGVVARNAEALAIYASADGRASLHLSKSFFVSMTVSLGAPIRAARVIGLGETVHEVGGLLVGTQLVAGLGW